MKNELELHGLIGGSGLSRFFGDGSDGALSTSGNVTLTSTLNGDPVIKQYTDLTINSGHTLTTSNPCDGLIIYVSGNLVINGAVTMSKKGGLQSTKNPLVISKELDKFLKTTSVLTRPTGGTGGNGGTNGSGDLGGTGGAGIFGRGGFGGGGAGGHIANGGGSWPNGGAGGAITYPNMINPEYTIQHSSPGGTTGNVVFAKIKGYAGQGGGGGFRPTDVNTNYWPAISCGAGGPSYGAGGGGGGGAQATSGSTINGSNGGSGEYAGGLIVFIVKGNITIGATGSITSAGGNGGGGGSGVGSGAHGCGGGGAGGGVIMLFYGGSYSNGGSVTVAGGTGGTGYSSGSSGSVGTIYTLKV